MNKQILNQNNEFPETIDFNIEKIILASNQIYESIQPAIEKIILASNQIYESMQPTIEKIILASNQVYESMQPAIEKIIFASNQAYESIQPAIEKMIPAINQIYESMNQLDSESMTKLKGICIEDINTTIKGYIDESNINPNKDIFKYLNNLIEKLNKQNPFLAFILFKVIFIILLNNLSNGIYDTAFKKDAITYNTKIEIVKKINNFHFEDYSNIHLRYVNKDYLLVRNGASEKSYVVGEIHFGFIVEVIDKKKNWCLITWYDQDENIIKKGWVYTRYLKKITR